MPSRLTGAAWSAVAVALVAPSALIAQDAPPANEVGAPQLALITLPASTSTKLTVTSPAFLPGADIPFESTQYRGNVFPGLSWIVAGATGTGAAAPAGPPGTKAYVVIMQDGDALRTGAPILHWTMVNIPANVMKLDAKMDTPPPGAQFGPNMRGSNQAYLGPRTPPGPKHRYHFQVFALDAPVPADSTANFAALTAAMKSHVLASGEVIGLGQAPPPPN